MQSLITEFSKPKDNILIIGRTRVWMVNAATCHPDHFIGTERKVALKPSCKD